MSHCLCSFVASLHQSEHLVSSLLPESSMSLHRQERSKAVEVWQKEAEERAAPEREARHPQRAWDSVLAERRRDHLLSEANQIGRTRLLSAAAWLRAMPSSSVGTLLGGETLRIAIALRVGAAVCTPHLCRWGSPADSQGHHSLTCRFSAVRHPRHTALNDVARRGLLSAGIPALIEPNGLDRGDG